MELVYCWIERSENGFIQEQGFNFYGEHHFSVKKVQNNGEFPHYILNYEQKEGVLGSSLYKSTPVVSNISAIVGENGSGKSTLLNEIFEFSSFVVDDSVHLLDENEGKNLGFEAIIILVYKIPCGEFRVFHNLAQYLTTKSVVENITLYNLAVPEEQYYLEISPHKYPDFKPYVPLTIKYENYPSGLFWGEERFSRDGYITGITLSTREHSEFFQFLVKKITFQNTRIKGFLSKNSFETIYSRLSHNFSRGYFQSWADAMYFYLTNTFSENCHSMILAPKFIEVSIINYNLKALEHYGRLFNATSLIVTLYLLLIEELQLNVSTNNGSDTDLDYYCECLETFVSSSTNDIVTSYCKIALNEIQELREILPDSVESYVTISSDSPEASKFCAWVFKTTVAETSFSLKYLDLRFNGLSSGQRAILTMMSRIVLIPNFREMIGEKNLHFSDYLILLIDEIDLYVHPEWQRKLINCLTIELGKHFQSKHVQIIITTHSPFLLSDIPVGNCIFLKPKDGKFYVETDDLPQTFAANLHTIAKNQFFMESTMGALTQRKLNELDVAFKTLEQNDIACTNKEKDSINSLISSVETKLLIQNIGEPILKNYFSAKLKKYATFISKEERISQLEHELKSLKGEV